MFNLHIKRIQNYVNLVQRMSIDLVVLRICKLIFNYINYTIDL